MTILQRLGAGEMKERDLRTVIADARDEVRRQAMEAGNRPREWASTLLIVITSNHGTLAAQIGDGSIVLDFGSGLELAFCPDQDMLNVTNFLVDDGAMESLLTRTFERATPQRLLLTSDGLIPVLLDLRKGVPHAPSIDRFMSVLDSRYLGSDTTEMLESLLSHEQVNARTDDDKSIVMAIRISPT
jgi:hypothetical protein